MLTACTVPLFVPGDRPERFAKALASGSDLVLLDLEDAVAPANKAAARAHVVAAIAAGSSAWVRVNPVRSPEGARDLEALAARPPRGVLVAKTAGPGDLAAARAALGADIGSIALVESLEGLRAIDEIAASADALAFGAYDLCAELGARAVPEVLAPLRSRIVIAARTAGIAAIDAPFIALDDDAGLRADARRAVDFGFDGKLAIHPKHVAPILAAFVPSEAERARAETIVAAAGRGGVAVVDGTMIDPPLVLAAQRVLARAAAGASEDRERC